jgi:hypothetical protein
VSTEPRRASLIVLASVVATLLVVGGGTAVAVTASRVLITNGPADPVPVTVAAAPRAFQRHTLAQFLDYVDVAGRSFEATDVAMISSVTVANNSGFGVTGVRIGSTLLGSHKSCSFSDLGHYHLQVVANLFVPKGETRQLTFPQPLLVQRQSPYCLEAWVDVDNSDPQIYVTVVGSVK